MAKLDRFQPPSRRDELYRCEGCYEMIDGSGLVFINDVPYHPDCLPEPLFRSEIEDMAKPASSALVTVLTWTGGSAIVLTAGLLLNSENLLVPGMILGLSACFILRVLRG